MDGDRRDRMIPFHCSVLFRKRHKSASVNSKWLQSASEKIGAPRNNCMYPSGYRMRVKHAWTRHNWCGVMLLYSFISEPNSNLTTHQTQIPSPPLTLIDPTIPTAAPKLEPCYHNPTPPVLGCIFRTSNGDFHLSIIGKPLSNINLVLNFTSNWTCKSSGFSTWCQVDTNHFFER